MAKTVQIVVRLDAETVQAIDRMPGRTRSEKLRTLLAANSAFIGVLMEQRAMLLELQKTVADLSKNKCRADGSKNWREYLNHE